MAELQAGDPKRIGPYVLVGRLGSGGMGRVYLARSPGGRQVAVKVIRAELADDAGFRARFAREVAAARKVGGLFTAQVVDADLEGAVPWLVTAFVPGMSLAEAVDHEGPLPPGTVLALAAGLAEGISAIHAAGVIHRDLKPSNVLLALDGPRIIDFGIASAVAATTLTGTGLMIGSPGFMSPEQAEGGAIGPPSDIFSLAGVLTYAIRGDGPFGSGETSALLYRVVHGTPNLDRVPGRLQPLISWCLSKEAARRPTAGEFLAELTATYPGAADLTDWLPPRLRDAAVQRASFAYPGRQPLAIPAGAGIAELAAGPGLAATGPVDDVAPLQPMRASFEPPPPTAPVSPQGAAGPATYPAPRDYPGAQGGNRGLTGPGGYGTPGTQAGPGGYGVQSGQERSGAQAGYEAQGGGYGAQGGLLGQGGGGQGGGLLGQGGGGQDLPPWWPRPTTPPPGSQGQAATQWYGQARPPVRRRRRGLWVAGIAGLCGAVIAAVVITLGAYHTGSSSTGQSPGAARSTTPATPTATPTVGGLALSQLRAGDCLTGANLQLNTARPWPQLAQAVSCGHRHTAEVFLANNRFWPENLAFPGSATIVKVADAACNSAFRSYVGIAYSKSIYTWTNVIPDASTWPDGDRGLHCVAYYATAKDQAGAYLTRSIKGSRR
ncbi:MAG: serine/threonine-protein kinase [Streptosporangiaceae bacterium]